VFFRLKDRIFLVVALVVLGLGLLSYSWFSPSSGHADSTSLQDKLGSYPLQGVRAGVFNDGQAALWDLNIIDHFHYFGPEERARGYRPEQPIQFSHVTHVLQNKMECTYCHWSVTKSAYAAVPEVETCMGCHQFVLGQTDEQREEIQKLHQYWQSGEQIPWENVHVMPNHVKFNHKRHVKAGVSCHSCHGQVGEMEVVERVSSMKMGWCISCHRMEGASIDCAVCHY